MASLPYVTAPGSITRALTAIKSAATPERVSQDFVKTVLGIPGGSGDQMTSYLKKIGFAAQNGTPTELYNSFRNPSTSKQAAAEALKKGYEPLFRRNEYMYRLKDEELKGLVVEETGQAADSNAVSCIFSCIKNLKEFADFSASTRSNEIAPSELPPREQSESSSPSDRLGLNLSYTINLNLPATADVAVFNAIFKSLKEHLLKE